MLQRLLCVVLGCLIIVGYARADQAGQYVEGKEYALIQPNKNVALPLPLTPGKIQVIEFFSYGCHWCNEFEPQLVKWLAQKPENVEFVKVPVAWNPEWELYAKAYYTAVALKVADKITPAMFKAIHQDQLPMSSPDDIKKIFVANGVSAADFDSTFNFSPGIDAQISRGRDLMQYYGVVAIPTLVINGQYKTDSGMMNGNIEKMPEILDYLVKKVQTVPNKSDAKTAAAPATIKTTVKSMPIVKHE